MKLENICEGLIKLPLNLKNELINYYVSMFISKVMDKTNNTLPVNFLNELHQKYDLQIYDIPENSDMQSIFNYSAKDIPKHYKTKQTRPRKILAIAAFTNNRIGTDAEGELQSTNSKANTIIVNLVPYTSDVMVNRISNNPDVIYQLIEKIKGVVEHELTHAIQRDFLSKRSAEFDLDRADSYRDDSGKIDTDKYLNTEFEKDPILKSSISDFRTIVDGYEKVTHTKMTEEKLRYVLSYFTNPDNDGTQMRILWPTVGAVTLANAPIHTPLRNWKPKDLKLWKRASKYFYDSIKDLI